MLGLPVFDVAIPDYPKGLCVRLDHGLVPQPGPCFATRLAEGGSWDGRGALLDALEHPEHIPGLVVLDTWLRNPDRYLVRAGRARRNLRNVVLTFVAEMMYGQSPMQSPISPSLANTFARPSYLV